MTVHIVLTGGPCDGARRILPELREHWTVPLQVEPMVPVSPSNAEAPILPAYAWALYALERDADTHSPVRDDQGCYRFIYAGTDSD